MLMASRSRSPVAALAELGQTPQAFQAAVARLRKKGQLASPRRGFYLILRPEDRSLGVPDPSRWIDPLTKHLGLDYRVSVPGSYWLRRIEPRYVQKITRQLHIHESRLKKHRLVPRPWYVEFVRPVFLSRMGFPAEKTKGG